MMPAPEPRSSTVSAAALRRPLARLWRAPGGATAIEMAFLLPVFLGLLLGIEEFGRALWTQTALQFAVSAAARCAAIAPSTCTAPGGSTVDVEAYAASQAFGLSIPSSAFTYTANANATANCRSVTTNIGTGGAMVQATYAFATVVPQLVPLNVTLSACSYHP
jgi:Flp pilus assembly protein TadG